MRGALRALSVVALCALAGGCNYAAYFIRPPRAPIAGLEVRMNPRERRSCLVAFMPGMFDTPDAFVEAGFVQDAVAASRACDLLLVDAHFGYYREGSVRERVTRDVVLLARARGYEQIWIVGVSMGGLGALLATQANPDQIDGVVLLAPFLGDGEVIDAVREAGGLAAWSAPRDADITDEAQYSEGLWAWLQGYATHPERMPALFIGVGVQDDRAGVELLRAVLPEARQGRAPGGHNWTTWRILWRRLLASPPWDPRGVSRIDH